MGASVWGREQVRRWIGGLRALGTRLWATRLGPAAVVGATLTLAPALGCATTPATEAPSEVSASGPARVGTGTSDADLDAILADLDELEAMAADGRLVQGADAEIAGFRLDHLVADLTTLLAGEPAQGTLYDVHVALGRALSLSALRQRPGADALALELFERAIELDAGRAEAHVRRGRVLIERGAAAEALEAFEQARGSSDAVVYVEDLEFYAALAAYEVGQIDEARRLLKRAAMQRPDSARIARLEAALDAAPARTASGGGGGGGEGAISFGLEGRSLVQYEVQGATWQLVHETLGFRIGLPLSWQMSEEQIDEDSGGFVQIVAPPVAGANRQWRSEQVTIWAVPIDASWDVDALTTAWLESVPDVGQVEELETLERPGSRHLRLTRTPYMEDARVGQALVVIEGTTGYVLECWGDPVSFLQLEPQLVEILRGFSPLGA